MAVHDVGEKSRDKAIAKAVAYINHKPRTRQQVIQYLAQKDFDRDVIEEVVAELTEYHYIDDFNFSVLYFQYGFEKGRGIGRIKRELSEKGVASDVIECAYEELDEIPDQEEMAMAIGASVVSGIDLDTLSYEEKRKLQAKVGRRLASRGFSSDVVYRVIKRLVQ